MSTADEIRRAIQAIEIGPERFLQVAGNDAQRVYESAKRRFVAQLETRWWWECFPTSTCVRFADGDGWQHLTILVPDAKERVWFIAEDSTDPAYSVWEANVQDIQSIVGECYGFEYYLIQQQYRWLICENHHDAIIAVGPEVEDKLRAYNVA